jgi:hypothetical protein
MTSGKEPSRTPNKNRTGTMYYTWTGNTLKEIIATSKKINEDD